MKCLRNIAWLIPLIIVLGCSGEVARTVNHDGPITNQQPGIEIESTDELDAIAMDAPVPNFNDDSLDMAGNIPARLQSANSDRDSNDWIDNRPPPVSFINSLRVWKDDQGLFSTNAELVAIVKSTRQIKLLKENGKTISVPFDRLSEHDQNYVRQFVTAQREKQKHQAIEAID